MLWRLRGEPLTRQDQDKHSVCRGGGWQDLAVKSGGMQD